MPCGVFLLLYIDANVLYNVNCNSLPVNVYTLSYVQVSQ